MSETTLQPGKELATAPATEPAWLQIVTTLLPIVSQLLQQLLTTHQQNQMALHQQLAQITNAQGQILQTMRSVAVAPPATRAEPV